MSAVDPAEEAYEAWLRAFRPGEEVHPAPPVADAWAISFWAQREGFIAGYRRGSFVAQFADATSKDSDS